MRNLFMSISTLSLLMLVMVGCSSTEPRKNHGDLSPNVKCMDEKGIKYEKRADGFYMSDNDWDHFIKFCS
ncbi:hypothetical protein H1164_15800 [Thermoactinomyces daqus]|uniref:Lipoprotein n=1 Tax=Thermoactinomyces daqus TaxID=1329516 RepID=A0A7W1XCV8_9BACL|nr:MULTISPECIES: hypothetical protein [Thermoactinomyces]MBA4544315.1 hypothetical protein [Thermoactinomyces daqus]MBH8605184.1 hypothetical protein [Thermoactinomyces sp. CICC 10522]